MHPLVMALLLVQAVPVPSTLYAQYNQVTKFGRHFSKYQALLRSGIRLALLQGPSHRRIPAAGRRPL